MNVVIQARDRAPHNFQVQRVITPYFWKWCVFAYFLCTVVLSTSEKIAYMYTFKTNKGGLVKNWNESEFGNTLFVENEQEHE
jgi:hypothetical protein